MALRLTPEPAATAEPLAARLAPRADRLLRDHDLPGWSALHRSVDDEPDVHRRYEARRTLGERALAHPGGSPAQVAARMLVVAGRLLHLLHDEPREPVLLNQAGVALYELGRLDDAEALFRAAHALDPRLHQVVRNLGEVRRRREAGRTRQDGLPVEVRIGVEALVPKVRDVVGRARPAEGLTVSLCMIVKDEEAMLHRCLAAAAPWVDELIVVDTGSTDRTVEIAESHGARVLHHVWQNDFAAARNVSFDAATSDWVLYLDADEVLVDGDGPRLRELLGRTWREALFLVETNHTGDLEDGTATTHDAMRLFRHRPERRFKGRLHEQIQHVPAYLPERLEVSTVRIEHFGYLGEVRERKDKVHRNRDLLERQFADGEDTPFLRFNLGMEHVAADDVHAAIPHLLQSWTALRDDPDRGAYGFVPMLASHLVDALRAAGRHDEALARAEEVLELFPSFTDVVLMQGHVHRATGDPARAEERYRHAMDLGDAPSTYVATVGAGTYLAARALADMLAGEGRDDEAEALLERTLREHPTHFRTAEALAALLLRRGLPAATVVRRIHGIVPDLPPSGRYLVAAALHRAGAADEAEAELRAVLAARPGSDAARLQLVETLVLQGRLEDAAAEAGRVPEDSPREEAALRHALFCRLAAGRSADDVLVRAATVLPPGDLALFAAWARRTDGTADGPAIPVAPNGPRGAAGSDASSGSATSSAAVGLPASAAELALTLLNALARLERFEAFERLAAVYERTALPWRQRRERLARLYLRRGFLQSAADEWMAVIRRDGPDVDALRGLAVIAQEMGMDDDAAVFAADADALAGVDRPSAGDATPGAPPPGSTATPAGAVSLGAAEAVR
ncbi:glycosyltransferase [Patulibacter minatonensis]|uniref:glycosyltransferase n=1 Tax=Patulibacter minatonensis TaxID=298163 RepID=UPI0004AD2DC1|nr:glycosyltransferase [Patulibacter minatonensis]